MKKVLNTFNYFIITIFVIASLAIAYVAIPQFGNKALVVRSGSMQPSINVGDMVVIKADSEIASPQNTLAKYKSGDVIAYKSQKAIVTHRIAGVLEKEGNVFYQTKGDANTNNDSSLVPQENVLGRKIINVPYFGKLVAFTKSNIGFPLLVIFPALFVILSESFVIFREYKKEKSLIQPQPQEPFRINLHAFLPIAVSALVAGSTFSYFSNIASSQNNIFAAAESFDPQPGDIVINEIMWMGSSVNAADEWLELRNMTSGAIDLSNWVIENLGSGTNSVTIPAGKTIAPNGYFLIANDPKETGAHNIDPDLVTTVGITNSPSEQLVLRVSSVGTIIDTADNSSGGWFAGVSGTGQDIDRSMERNIVPGDGTVSTNWHTATTATNIDGGAPDLATPKATNSTP